MTTGLIILIVVAITILYFWLGFGCFKMYKKQITVDNFPDLFLVALWPIVLIATTFA